LVLRHNNASAGLGFWKGVGMPIAQAQCTPMKNHIKRLKCYGTIPEGECSANSDCQLPGFHICGNRSCFNTTVFKYALVYYSKDWREMQE